MAKPITDAYDRMLARIAKDPASGCWNWLGTTVRETYGVINEGGRKGGLVYTHRLAYERLVGPIPAGLDLDHLCRNKRCCNPAHLEPVTRSENTKRGLAPEKTRKIWGDKTHCVNGHPFDAENTRHRPSGGRTCRACAREKARQYYRQGSQLSHEAC